MITGSLIAGILALILSTIARYMIYKNNKPFKSRISNLFAYPPKDNIDVIFASIGQFMGMLWIMIGIFLAMTEEWFSSSIFGVIAEPIIVFTPFLICATIFKLLAKSYTRKLG